MRIQGGTVATLDPMDFDEWGNFIGSARPVTQPFGYAGGIYNPAGMWHFGARDYMPGLRRWLARDPSGFEGG